MDFHNIGTVISIYLWGIAAVAATVGLFLGWLIF